MLKNISLLVVLVLLFGCSSNKPKYITKLETVTVYKPVYTPPESVQRIEPIDRPDLKTNYIVVEDKSDPGKVVKIVIESMAQLRAYAEQLENQNKVLLEIYKRPADPLPETERSVKTIED